ncbi:MAG: hypothetical protein AMJ78_05840 [Omnitrophica WOR_2 bacterium SM23_29]|nr:MAG: hypothetical protein AMJ78_05840 [Omnitrophica WOR_2 bacterium SM23_29]
MKKGPTIILSFLFFLSIIQSGAFSQDNGEMTIKDYLERALPPQEGRKIVYNEQAKLLTVIDTKSNHRLIKQLIEQFEVGPRQVMIETRFVEVDVTDLSELGIEWFAQVPGRSHSTKFFSDWSLNPAGTPDTTSWEGVQWDDSTETTFPKVGWTGLDIQMAKTTHSLKHISNRIKALEEKGKANLLSAPKVTTVSGQMANIQVVRKYPYVSDFTLENIGTAENPIWNYKLTLSEKPIGIALEVTPYVSEGSNTITLDLHPEVGILKDQVVISNLRAIGTTGSDIGAATIAVGGGFAAQTTAGYEAGTALIPDELGWPVVDIRTTQTSISIDSGETIVLGGMIKDEETVTKRKIPILGDIPLLGRAFKYDYKNIKKKNLLIFITASIVTADGEIIR